MSPCHPHGMVGFEKKSEAYTDSRADLNWRFGLNQNQPTRPMLLRSSLQVGGKGAGPPAQHAHAAGSVIFATAILLKMCTICRLCLGLTVSVTGF